MCELILLPTKIFMMLLYPVSMLTWLHSFLEFKIFFFHKYLHLWSDTINILVLYLPIYIFFLLVHWSVMRCLSLLLSFFWLFSWKFLYYNLAIIIFSHYSLHLSNIVIVVFLALLSATPLYTFLLWIIRKTYLHDSSFCLSWKKMIIADIIVIS